MSSWNIYWTSTVRLTVYIWKNYIYNENKRSISDIFVIISIPLLKLSYLRWEISIILYLIFGNPESNNIFIHKYIKSVTLTILLALWLFIILSLILVYMQILSNSQRNICIIKRMLYYKINAMKIFLTNILGSLIIHNIYVTSV